jgi:hypothetical protein
MPTHRLKPSKALALSSVEGLIAGTQTHFPDDKVTLGSTKYTTASLVQRFQRLADAINSLNAAQAAAADALTALLAVHADVGPLMKAYKRFVLAVFFDSTQTLADFRLTPPKVPAPRTAEQQAVAAAKLRATRKARGTTSRKQKLAIKGDVTGIVIEPITTAAPERTRT